MNIAVYWEQISWGGTDAHLLSLLSDWPDKNDNFVVIYNRGNRGFDRIRPQLCMLPNIAIVETTSYLQVPLSTNWMARKIFRLAGYVFRPFLFLLMVSHLKSVLRKAGSFDVLISNNGGYPAAWGCLSALLAAVKIGIPVRVLIIHHAATRNGVFMGWFEQLVDRVVSNVASAIVCVSHATQKTVIERRWLADNEQLFIKVIHNGIRPAKLDNTDRGALSLRQSIGMLPCEVLIGIVGRVEPYKGHEDVILGISRLAPAHLANLRLIVIGAGEPDEIARLKRLAHATGVSEHISFPGYIAGESVEFIREMDLLVVATRTFEGFGLTLAEAMQVGTPILTTRVGAIPEFVNEKLGELVQAGEPEEIANALADFLDNRSAWKLRAERACEHIKKFNSKSMAEKYRRFLVERRASV